MIAGALALLPFGVTALRSLRRKKRTLQNRFGSTPVRTLALAVMTLLTCHIAKAAMADFGDSNYWTPQNSSSGAQLTPVDNGNGFQVNFASGVLGGVGYQSAFTLQGDFDIQVNYTLTDWPTAPNSACVGISLGPYIGSMRLSTVYTSGDAYAFETTSTGLAYVPTTDQSGSLRIARVGNTLSGYYWSAANSAWMLTGSATGYSQNFGVFIGSWITEGIPTTGQVGDIESDLQMSGTLITGNVVPSPVPEPSTMIAGALALLPFGFTALRSLRKRQLA
jgi:hypothetical protein